MCFATLSQFVLDVYGALAALAALLRNFRLRFAVTAKKLGHHVHVDQFGDATGEAGATAAGTVGDVHQADVYFFQAGHLHRALCGESG